MLAFVTNVLVSPTLDSEKLTNEVYGFSNRPRSIGSLKF